MSTKPEQRRGKRRRRSRQSRSKPGAAPGTLSIDPEAPRPSIRVVRYDTQHLDELTLSGAAEIAEQVAKPGVTWVNVVGLGDEAILRDIGEQFGLHPLALEDVVNVVQRPKVETYDGHHFIVARTVAWDGSMRGEQLSLFLGKGFVLTFLERADDYLEPVRERLRRGRGRIRSEGEGYLAYAILDALVDHYFPMIERVGEELEKLEDQVIDHPTPATLTRIRDLKRELLATRRAIWPLRDAINVLLRDDLEHVAPELRLFFRDVHDHVVQVVELVETYRELGSGLMDSYMSSVSNRMNEVMKVLTVVASVFIPLTFIAGIYGMNFDREASPMNLPELGWPFGYLFFWGLIAVVAIGQIVWFRRKGWLGKRAAQQRERVDP